MRNILIIIGLGLILIGVLSVTMAVLDDPGFTVVIEGQEFEQRPSSTDKKGVIRGIVFIAAGIFIMFFGSSIKETKTKYVSSPQGTKVQVLKEQKNPLVRFIEICAAIAGIIGVIIAYLQFTK